MFKRKTLVPLPYTITAEKRVACGRRPYTLSRSMATVLLLTGEKGFQTIKFVTLLAKMDQKGGEREPVKVIPEIEEPSEKLSEPFGKIKKVIFSNEETRYEVGQLWPLPQISIHSQERSCNFLNCYCSE